MPTMSDAQKHKLLMEQEIARLSGAISRHVAKPHPVSYHPYTGRSIRGRGSFRGRGSTHGLDLRGKNQLVQPAVKQNKMETNSLTRATPPALAPANGVKIPDEGDERKKVELEAGEVVQEMLDKVDDLGEQNWVTKTSKKGNMSLMTVEKSQELKSKPRQLKHRHPRIPPQIQIFTSTPPSSSSADQRRVVIDGVIFQFDEGGQKLVRIGELDSQSSQSSSSRKRPNTPTRRSVRYDGQKYRRTSKGNLVSTSRRRRWSQADDSAELAKKPCRYYTKTDGWCDKVEGTCGDLHIWECEEWRKTGKCSKNGKCGLRHVFRSTGRGNTSTKQLVDSTETRSKDSTINLDKRPIPALSQFENSLQSSISIESMGNDRVPSMEDENRVNVNVEAFENQVDFIGLELGIPSSPVNSDEVGSGGEDVESESGSGSGFGFGSGSYESSDESGSNDESEEEEEEPNVEVTH
ncbi:hypothetical protein TREMEDRAFT_58043 [Tremella mesenterica DSM 1558]|uniref:uncharacterized protein n=1 Tax=Tremella mesenterica (strain ATCC 24925 / CBS 8224 / DSM 1558 / NBRC 9311 / NRRL Y-6157 / RJB 2259-6 / UBC 559-6) TaxID=578456 RepID=UPI0003F492BD|nr:uncharacterized protein TREMEDRAFT_58043 [Tremella mesenterica DSM 1558]EIW71909.1 hypothetical protein TREMEDRAFT_58043 [Tremella mesenterica DSM 1558]